MAFYRIVHRKDTGLGGLPTCNPYFRNALRTRQMTQHLLAPHNPDIIRDKLEPTSTCAGLKFSIQKPYFSHGIGFGRSFRLPSARPPCRPEKTSDGRASRAIAHRAKANNDLLCTMMLPAMFRQQRNNTHPSVSVEAGNPTRRQLETAPGAKPACGAAYRQRESQTDKPTCKTSCVTPSG
jgi:hypothetical protein